jgi:WD40 repeat protein
MIKPTDPSPSSMPSSILPDSTSPGLALPGSTPPGETQEAINLRLTGEKIRWELVDLQRPYLFRNPQLLTALISSLGALIVAGMLIEDKYYAIQKLLNDKQAAETKQLNADAETAKANAAKVIGEAAQKTKAAEDQLISTQERLLDLQVESALFKTKELLAQDQSVPAQQSAVEAWRLKQTEASRKAVTDAYSRPILTLALSRHDAAGFSPDGGRVVCADAGDTPKILDTATGKQLAALAGHSGRISAVIFSGDGLRVATGGNDNTARVWDAATGTQLAKLQLPAPNYPRVESAALSPDGRRIVTVGNENSAVSPSGIQPVARLWNVDSQTMIAKLEGSNAVFSPDGRLALTFGNENPSIWEAATGKKLLPLLGNTCYAGSAEFSPDSSLIVTGCSDGSAQVWNAATGKPTIPLAGHTKQVNMVMFSPKGLGDGYLRVVTASDDNTARIWDTVTGKPLAELKGHIGKVTTAVFSADGQRVVTASYDNTVRVWNAKTGALLAKLQALHFVGVSAPTGYSHVYEAAAFLPDGQRVFSVRNEALALYSVVLPEDVDRLFSK